MIREHVSTELNCRWIFVIIHRDKLARLACLGLSLSPKERAYWLYTCISTVLVPNLFMYARATRMPPRDFAFWARSQAAIVFVIFLDFHSTKHGLPLVDSWSHGLDYNEMYPDRDTFEQLYRARNTLQHVIKACWKVARQKAGKTLCQFFFFFFFYGEWTQKHKNEASS